MDYLSAIILGIIEGITEFLPISSTGHLILASKILQLPSTEFVKSFEIIIQLGAILAIVVLYWKTLLQKRDYWPKLFLAFLPTALVGFTLYPFIKNVLLSSPLITLLTLFGGGVVLIVIEFLHKEQEHHTTDLSHLSTRQAILIGLFQSIAIIPGVSRAGATIIGAMLVGTKRKTAVEFSFILAIPTMLAASALDLMQSMDVFTKANVSVLGVGFLTSFLVAIVAVKYFVRFIGHHTFISFGIYRILLAIIYLFFFIL